MPTSSKLPLCQAPGIALGLVLAAAFFLPPLLAQTEPTWPYTRRILSPNESGPGSGNPYPDTLVVNGNYQPYPNYLDPELNSYNPDNIGNQAYAQMGFVDVTAEPFFAQTGLPANDPDHPGVVANTIALNRAIDFARHFQMVCFFPEGTYVVNDTIEAAQGYLNPSKGPLRGDRYGPCVLMGSRLGDRPVIRLANNSEGFDDPGVPRPVVYFWARSKGWPGAPNPADREPDPEKSQPNINYHQKLINIDIEIGWGNPGASGVDFQGAQGTSIQGCAITFIPAVNGWPPGGVAGLRGASGSGGSHIDLTVNGGTYGIDMIGAQPNDQIGGGGAQGAPTLSVVRLNNQTGPAIRYAKNETLTVVGFKIDRDATGPGPAIEARGGGSQPHHGRICLVDGKISYNGGQLADNIIETDRPIYLRDVWVRNATNVIQSESATNPPVSGTVASLDPTQWVHCHEVAHTVNLPEYNHKDLSGPVQYEATSYLFGEVQEGQEGQEVDPSGPQNNIVFKHVWFNNFPHFEQPDIVNVKDYGVAGDGVTDDTDALQTVIDANRKIFLPKGLYRISKTLQLREDTHIFGAAESYSVLVADHRAANGVWNTTEIDQESDFRDPDNDPSNGRPSSAARPMMRTGTSSQAVNFVGFLGFFASHQVPCAYPLDWQAGNRSICRSLIFNRDPLLGKKYAWRLDSYSTNFPLVRISGNGGGKWYNLVHGFSNKQTRKYRHLFVFDTTNRLEFYHLNPEYIPKLGNKGARDTAVQIANSENVHIYGLKGEGRHPLLWIQDSSDFRVFGFGGISNAWWQDTLFQLENCQDFLLSNLTERPRPDMIHPANWFSIMEDPPNGDPVATEPLDRPVVYRRGQPAEDY